MHVRLPRKLYFIALVVLFAAAVGAYFAFLRDLRRQQNLSAEADAKITKTDIRHSVDPETGMQRIEDTIISYEYEIDGRKYARTIRMGKVAASSFIPWGEAKVCYNPSDSKTIENAQLFPKQSECGAGWVYKD